MQRKIDTHVFKGMQRDMDPNKQSGEYYIDAHNIRLTLDDSGGKLVISSERNEAVVGLEGHDSEFQSILGEYKGHCVLNNYLVIFTRYYINTSTTTVDTNYIYRVDTSSSELVCLYVGDLNIHDTVETLAGYENPLIQKVYWTDGINQPRLINIMQAELKGVSYETMREIYLETTTPFDFVPELALGETVTVTKEASSSGSFPAGVVQYALTYYNKYRQESNVAWVSPLYYTSFQDRAGSPEETIGNAFKLGFSGLDTNFDYARLYSVVRTSLDSTPMVRRVIDIPLRTYEDVSGESGVSLSFLDGSVTFAYDFSVYLSITASTYDSDTLVTGTDWVLMWSTYVSCFKLRTDPLLFTGDARAFEFSQATLGSDYSSLVLRVPGDEGDYYYTFNPNVSLPSGCTPCIRVYVDPCDTGVFYGKYLIVGYYIDSAGDYHQSSVIYRYVRKSTTISSYTFIDDNTRGETVDPTYLLYVGGEEVTAETICQKDGTLFMGNLSITRPSVVGMTIKSSSPSVTCGTRSLAITRQSSFYPYGNTLNAGDCPLTFKRGETYRLGLQFQYKNGKWSEPLYLSDVQMTSQPSHSSSGSYDNLPTYSYAYDFSGFLDLGYKKVRPVVVIPSLAERQVIAQGLLCPTVYSLKDRTLGTPYVQSSWFTRIYNTATPHTSNDVFSTGGSYIQARHGYTLHGWCSRSAEIQGVPLDFSGKQASSIFPSSTSSATLASTTASTTSEETTTITTTTTTSSSVTTALGTRTAVATVTTDEDGNVTSASSTITTETGSTTSSSAAITLSHSTIKTPEGVISAVVTNYAYTDGTTTSTSLLMITYTDEDGTEVTAGYTDEGVINTATSAVSVSGAVTLALVDDSTWTITTVSGDDDPTVTKVTTKNVTVTTTTDTSTEGNASTTINVTKTVTKTTVVTTTAYADGSSIVSTSAGSVTVTDTVTTTKYDDTGVTSTVHVLTTTETGTDEEGNETQRITTVTTTITETVDEYGSTITTTTVETVVTFIDANGDESTLSTSKETYTSTSNSEGTRGSGDADLVVESTSSDTTESSIATTTTTSNSSSTSESTPTTTTTTSTSGSTEDVEVTTTTTTTSSSVTTRTQSSVATVDDGTGSTLSSGSTTVTSTTTTTTVKTVTVGEGSYTVTQQDCGNVFAVDQQFQTFHSPDIVWDEDLWALDWSSMTVYDVGTAGFTSSAGDISMQTSSTTISSDGSGFVHYNVQDTDDGTRCLSAGLMYDDYLVDDSGDDDWPIRWYKHEKNPVKYMVYPWHKSGSLNNDCVRPANAGERSAVLKEKVISNIHVSNSITWRSSASLGVNNMALFNSDEMSACRLGDNLYYGNIDTLLPPVIPYGSMFMAAPSKDSLRTASAIISYADTIYTSASSSSSVNTMFTFVPKSSDDDTVGRMYGVGVNSSGIDVSLTGSDETNIGDKNTTRGLTMSREAIRMKYKSTPHLVIELSSALTSSYATTGALQMAEIRRSSAPTFGGTTNEAIQANLWLPAGPAVAINESGTTTVTWMYGDTFFQRFDCLKTYPYTQEDENQIVDIVSFDVESRVNCDGRYDKNRGLASNLYMTPSNFNLHNPVYNQLDNYFTYRILDSDYYSISSYPNTVTWSLEKTSASDVDPWTDVTMASTLDMDGDKGSVVALRTNTGDIYCFQDKMVSIISFNARTQINTSDGVPIEISNNYKVSGKDTVLDNVGADFKWSVCNTPGGIYFIDSQSKDLYNISGRKPANVSLTCNMSSWFKALTERCYLWYDYRDNDLYVKSGSEVLNFSEILGQFVSFLDPYGKLDAMATVGDGLYGMGYLELGTRTYGFRLVRLKSQDFGVSDSSVGLGTGLLNPPTSPFVPTSYDITFISNDDASQEKVFTNINVRGDWYVDGEIDHGITFDTLQVSNEYQDTGAVSVGYDRKSHSSGIAKKKFRIWRFDIPRAALTQTGIDSDGNPVYANGRRDRIANMWAKIKMTTVSYPMRIHDLDVQYYIR